MKNQPLKRSEALKTFSREHHFGLLFTWKIKQGLKLNVETSRLLKYVNYFWEEHLKEHFYNEEVLLFNKIDTEVCTQAKSDHQLIMSQIEHLNATDQSDYDVYQMFIDKLNSHIRYEERVVFPYLERTLSTSLKELLHPLEKEHDKEFIDEFQDEFWKQ